MRTLRRAALPLVVAVIAVVVLAEVGGRFAVERITAQRIREAGVAGTVDVTVGTAWWKPSVLPALLGADLDRIELRMRDADLQPVGAEVADYVLEDLEVAISLRARTIGVTDLGRGTVTLMVEPSSIGELLGIEATVSERQLLVGPDEDAAELSVDGDELVVTSAAFAADGGSTRLPVVDPWVLPCTPAVRLAGGLVELTCSGDRLPGVLGLPLGPDESVDPDDVVPPPVELQPPATVELEPTTTSRPTASTTTTLEGGG